MPMFVKEIMSTPPITIELTETAKHAGKKMKEKRKGFLVVVNNGEPVGVLSDSDLIREIVAGGKDPEKVLVEDMMSAPVITTEPSAEVMSVINKMRKTNIHRLPVLDDNKVVGIVSLTDIARSSPEMYYLLEYRQKMKTQPFIIKEEVTSGICDNCGNFSDNLKETPDSRWMCESCRDEF